VTGGSADDDSSTDTCLATNSDPTAFASSSGVATGARGSTSVGRFISNFW
jgi:hypothetical protein